jgi:hypothetical protein
LPDIDPGVSETRQIVSAIKRQVRVVLAVAALCAAVAGCVSDMGAPTADSGNGQLRYYGGPKSPMWSGQ